MRGRALAGVRAGSLWCWVAVDFGVRRAWCGARLVAVRGVSGQRFAFILQSLFVRISCVCPEARYAVVWRSIRTVGGCFSSVGRSSDKLRWLTAEPVVHQWGGAKGCRPCVSLGRPPAVWQKVGRCARAVRRPWSRARGCARGAPPVARGASRRLVQERHHGVPATKEVFLSVSA